MLLARPWRLQRGIRGCVYIDGMRHDAHAHSLVNDLYNYPSGGRKTMRLLDVYTLSSWIMYCVLRSCTCTF